MPPDFGHSTYLVPFSWAVSKTCGSWTFSDGIHWYPLISIVVLWQITTFQICLLPPPRDCINCIKCIVSQRNNADLSFFALQIASSKTTGSVLRAGDLDVIWFSHILSLGPLFKSVFLHVYPYSCDSMECLDSMDFIDAKWCKYCFLRGPTVCQTGSRWCFACLNTTYENGCEEFEHVRSLNCGGWFVFNTLFSTVIFTDKIARPSNLSLRYHASNRFWLVPSLFNNLSPMVMYGPSSRSEPRFPLCCASKGSSGHSSARPQVRKICFLKQAVNLASNGKNLRSQETYTTSAYWILTWWLLLHKKNLGVCLKLSLAGTSIFLWGLCHMPR